MAGKVLDLADLTKNNSELKDLLAKLAEIGLDLPERVELSPHNFEFHNVSKKQALDLINNSTLFDQQDDDALYDLVVEFINHEDLPQENLDKIFSSAYNEELGLLESLLAEDEDPTAQARLALLKKLQLNAS